MRFPVSKLSVELILNEPEGTLGGGGGGGTPQKPPPLFSAFTPPIPLF